MIRSVSECLNFIDHYTGFHVSVMYFTTNYGKLQVSSVNCCNCSSYIDGVAQKRSHEEDLSDLNTLAGGIIM